MRVLLVSTYELGHQPLHVASPAAALVTAGHEVRTLDLSIQPWDDEAVGWAERVGFSVPMHTATRLALAAAERIAATRPGLPICFYGLYAGMVPDRYAAIAGEYEPALVAWADGQTTLGDGPRAGAVHLARHPFPVPRRDDLPGLDRYARLAVGGEQRVVGYVEGSRGCSHRCRHCPVPVVYDGRVRTVPEDVVLADVSRLVAAGARHLTFGDPDFLNAVPHSRRLVDAVHGAFPDLTFDCTVKVEHILRHADLWDGWRAAGCLFVVSAVECVNDEILRHLDKGHSAADASAAVGVLRRHRIELRPSLLPFTPWTTLDDVVDLVRFVADHDLVANVDPVQYTIRLLLPAGSLLLERPDLRARVGPYDRRALSHPWAAADPRVDALQVELRTLVERAQAGSGSDLETFVAVHAAVHRAAERPEPDLGQLEPDDGRPRLTEPWFCCAEPTDAQLQPIT